MNAPLPYWPAALRLDQAAAYVGLSVDTFKEVCPIKPIHFTQSTRGHRYVRASLDGRLEALIPILVRALQSGDYSSEQMEAALGSVFGGCC